MTDQNSAGDARAHLRDAARSLIAAARAALDVAEGIVENPPSRPGPSAKPGVQRIRVQPDEDADDDDRG